MIETFVITALESWQPCFERLLAILQPGSSVALSGPLGAGKTTCVQEFIKFLGGKTNVKSPTFALMRTYRVARPPFERVIHIDAYRLDREEDAQVLGLDEELQEPGTVACIEWPERLPIWMVEQAERVVWLTIQAEQENGSRMATLEWRA